MIRQKPNYEFKAQVINDSWCDLESKVSKARFDYEQGLLDDRQFLELTEPYHNALSLGLCKEWHEAEKINHAAHQRKLRLKNRITYMVEQYPCLFLTLTFEDSVLERTTAETRRQYVKKYLSNYGTLAIANIDFGKTNAREHYHAVIGLERISLDDWPFGFPFVEVVKTKTKDMEKLSKYITKLTNHAIKETTKRQPLLYVGWRKLLKDHPELDI